MQISATTLLAQQAPRVAPKAPQPTDAFEPLSFKQAAKAPQASMPEIQATTATKSGSSSSAGLSSGPSAAYVRPGTNIDIKV
jgi:hypothetical protein